MIVLKNGDSIRENSIIAIRFASKDEINKIENRVIIDYGFGGYCNVIVIYFVDKDDAISYRDKIILDVNSKTDNNMSSSTENT